MTDNYTNPLTRESSVYSICVAWFPSVPRNFVYTSFWTQLCAARFSLLELKQNFSCTNAIGSFDLPKIHFKFTMHITFYFIILETVNLKPHYAWKSWIKSTHVRKRFKAFVMSDVKSKLDGQSYKIVAEESIGKAIWITKKVNYKDIQRKWIL